MSSKQPWALACFASRAGLVAALALLGACAHVHSLAAKASPSHWSLPWHHKAPPPAETVHELSVPGGGAELPQAWDRNTLRVDLSGLAGEGDLKLQRAAGHDWPIRMAFTVRPGGIGHLEVKGDQRVVLTVPESGLPVVLELPPGLYNPTTPSLALRYGP